MRIHKVRITFQKNVLIHISYVDSFLSTTPCANKSFQFNYRDAFKFIEDSGIECFTFNTAGWQEEKRIRQIEKAGFSVVPYNGATDNYYASR